MGRKLKKAKKVVTVEFTESYAIFKPGDLHACDSMEAALIVKSGVAKYAEQANATPVVIAEKWKEKTKDNNNSKPKNKQTK